MKPRHAALAVALAVLAGLVPAGTAEAIDGLSLFSFTGHVTDPWSRPVVTATVSDQTRNVVTNSTGAYKLDETKFGEFRLNAFHSSMVTSPLVTKTVNLPTDDTHADFQLLYRLTGQLNKTYLSTSAAAASATLTLNAYAPSPGTPAGGAGTSCVSVTDSRTGVTAAATWAAVNTDASQRWTFPLTVPAHTREGQYSLTAITKDCSTGTTLSEWRSTTYTIDNTAPTADANDIYPNTVSNATVASPKLAARIYDRNPLDLSSLAFTLYDDTAGTVRVIAGAAATRYSATTLWAKTAAGQPLTVGHAYHIKVAVKDAAGNETVVEQPATADRGGFDAASLTVTARPHASITERSCSVAPPPTGQAMATVTCENVPVDFTPTTTRLSSAIRDGSIPMTLSVPLSGVTIRYGVGGALTQTDTSVKAATATATATAPGVQAHLTAADYTAPPATAVIPTITAKIPAAFTTATVVMNDTDQTAVNFTGCADVTVQQDVTCTPDDVAIPPGVTRRLQYTGQVHIDPTTNQPTVEDLTATYQDFDGDGNPIDSGTLSVTPRAGGTSSGQGCESGNPGRIESAPPLSIASSATDAHPVVFAWMFYPFFKDDGREYNGSTVDLTDFCYWGWADPAQDWRLTMSGASVAFDVANAKMVSYSGGNGNTTDPTTASVNMELRAGPVTISGAVGQTAIQQVRHAPGPGPTNSDFGSVAPSNVHNAWWQYTCSGLVAASCWMRNWGVSSAQGNVGHAVYTSDRDFYSSPDSPPYPGFVIYQDVHCSVQGFASDGDCRNLRELINP